MPPALRSALRITLAYALFGSLWILFSDRWVEWLFTDINTLTRVQTIKGWLFILVTASLLFGLVSKAFLSIENLHRSDTQTRLLRHPMFKQLIDAQLKRIPEQQTLMVIHVDIDDFSDVNSRLGFEQADTLLINIADTLRDKYTANTLLARLGIDQFGIALQTQNSNEKIDEELRELRLSLSEAAGAVTDGISFTIGVALSPMDGKDAKKLLSSSSRALHKAKQHSRGGEEFYNDRLSKRENDRQQLLTDLRLAIAEHALSVVYQPQYRLPDLQITGVEVLIRWHHPERGFISPDVFIPLAEEYGLSDKISAFVVQQTLKELSENRLLGNAIPRVSVNISAIEFNSEPLLQALTNTLRRTPHLLPFLQLEITETAALTDIGHCATIMHRLKSMGLRFSIDDFGTGYSSLAMLKTLPIDEIKIDRSFVHDMHIDHKVETLIKAILSMASGFDVSVVAEGIETEEQLNTLTTLGCHEAQGYLLCKPLPIHELRNIPPGHKSIHESALK